MGEILEGNFKNSSESAIWPGHCEERLPARRHSGERGIDGQRAFFGSNGGHAVSVEPPPCSQAARSPPPPALAPSPAVSIGTAHSGCLSRFRLYEALFTGKIQFSGRLQKGTWNKSFLKDGKVLGRWNL